MAKTPLAYNWPSFFSSKSSSVATLPTLSQIKAKSQIKAGLNPGEIARKTCRRLLRNPSLPPKQANKQLKALSTVEAQFEDEAVDRPSSKPAPSKFAPKLSFTELKKRRRDTVLKFKPVQTPVVVHSLEISLKKIVLNEREIARIRLKPRYRSIPPVQQDQSKDSIFSNDEDSKPTQCSQFPAKRNGSKDSIALSIERMVRQQAHKRTSSTLLHSRHIKPLNIHFLLKQSEARKPVLKSEDPCDPQNLRLPMYV